MKVAVLTRPPEAVPVTVTVTPDATGAVAAAVNVNVDVAAGLAGVTGFGVNADAVTPVCRPEIDKVTACEPAPAVTNKADTVEAALVVPCTIFTVVGATERL